MDNKNIAGSKAASWLNLLTASLWVGVLLVIFIRVAHSPHRNTVFTTYEAAGGKWIAAKDLYTNSGGFVYSPLAAAFFAPFSVLPDLTSNILWRLLNAGMLLGAVWWWLKSGLHRGIPTHRYSMVFLLLLPLTIGNLNNGQANPMLVGILMLAVIGAKTGRWNLAAICIALTAYFKIYPLVVGLLLALIFPQKFSWRLVIALILLGALTFLLQRPGFVMQEYQRWIFTRLHDDRKLYKPDVAPRDLWLLLRFLHIPVSKAAYTAMQIGGGAAIAAVCWFGKIKHWSMNRLLVAIFTLASCWMLLLGPATESATYVLLAPALVLALVESFEQPIPTSLRALLVTALAILFAALCVNSFTHFHRESYAMVIQPIGAVLFSCYAAIWLVPTAFWPQESSASTTNDTSRCH